MSSVLKPFLACMTQKSRFAIRSDACCTCRRYLSSKPKLSSNEKVPEGHHRLTEKTSVDEIENHNDKDDLFEALKKQVETNRSGSDVIEKKFSKIQRIADIPKHELPVKDIIGNQCLAILPSTLEVVYHYACRQYYVKLIFCVSRDYYFCRFHMRSEVGFLKSSNIFVVVTDTGGHMHEMLHLLLGKEKKIWWDSEMSRPSIRERLWQSDPIVELNQPRGLGKFKPERFVAV